MKKMFLILMILFTCNIYASGRAELDKQTLKNVLEVLKANEEVHKAFFRYDGSKVEHAVNVMKEKASKISNKEINKLLKFSITKLNDIKAQAEREDNNKNYHIFSTALIYVIKKYDVGTKYNAYSCPMVQKKWVQNSKLISKVSNPYSAAMPGCGTRDTNF